MAFTKVLGPGIHTLSNITSHNIHSSGIVTAVSFVGDGSSLTGIANTDYIVGTAITMGTGNFTGNLTVGGVLTYEDVKNVDSVGLITAREGIHIPDNKRLDFGGTAGDGDFEIRHTSGNTFIENNTGSFFISQGTAAASSPLTIHGGSELQLKHYYGNGGQLFALKSVRGYQTEIYWQGQKKIETTSTGITVTGSVVATGADINGDLDVDGHTNLDNVSIAGVTTFSTSPVVPNGGYYKGIINSGSQEKIVGGYISGTDTLRLGESMYLTSTGLGIGDNNPNYMLQLKGTIPAIALEDTSGTHGFSVIEQNDDNLKIRCDAGNQSSGYN